jgi:hypothetical protein
MRVTVIGNCQAAGLASCLATMVPGLQIAPRGPATPVELMGLCESHDWVVMQGEQASVPPALADRIITWPRLIFAAFHPDAVYVHREGRVFGSVLGQYHSALALLGWMAGRSVAETRRLFRSDVYERAGYFSVWESSRRALLSEGEASGLSLEAALDEWASGGCFMHSPNHPYLPAIADLARAILPRLGLSASVARPERFVSDALARSLVLPVYPEIAQRLGIAGDYAFKLPARIIGGMEQVEVLDLDAMIARSFAQLEGVDPASMACPRFDAPAWQTLLQDLPALVATPLPKAGGNPYRGLPAHQYWRQSIAETPGPEVDPVVAAPFTITRRTAIATAGSCFAQHIARTLKQAGYNHMVVEPPPPELSPAQVEAGHWGAFSARYGNLYTARQLVQLIERAEGRFRPADTAWRRPDGRWVDPFRPQIEPAGHASRAEVIEARKPHLQAVRRMLRRVEVFVFTLGLTESWRARADGAVFPLAPGVVAGEMDPAAYEFVNFSTAEVLADLHAFHAALRAINPGVKLVLTVSPVPLVATYEPRHVLVSTVASKSILRAAAEEFCRAVPECWYFPSYEIVTGPQARGTAFGPDLREVTEATVARVMSLFLRHAAQGAAATPAPAARAQPAAAPAIPDAETAALFQVLCDEEKLGA